MADLRMPSLGADMRFGTLLEWHVKPGDSVRRGDIAALVDTENAAIDAEIFEGGRPPYLPDAWETSSKWARSSGLSSTG
jgi:pyruvate/2-oxoglutarate dehydrogenase complex dihydrolipoamide acyltransferase (E2) component